MTNHNNAILKYLLIASLLLLSGLNTLSAQKVQLTGKAPMFAGESITFYTYSDYITKDTIHLGSAMVHQNGTFTCFFPLEQVKKIFTNLGVYKGYFYAEPGKQYELVLPDKKEKDKAQEMNPYFERTPIHVGIKNTNRKELNYQIDQFSDHYDRIINKNMNNVKYLARHKDSIYNLLDTIIEAENPFFKNYKEYRLAGLKLSLGYPTHPIKKEYLAGQKVLYHNPAYMDLLSTLYQNYFKDLFSEHGYEVYYIINRLKSHSKLDSLVQRDTILKNNDRLRELVILKGLDDAYYDKSFSKKAVKSILDSVQHIYNHEEILGIARNIMKNNTTLSQGDPAPDFCLYDRDSNRVCLENLKGNYVYLGFCSPMNYSCMRHYNILENLYKQHKQHFKIVIILNTDSFEQMKRFAEHHSYPWTFLYLDDHKEILNKYRIKNIPTYFFINPESKLSLVPAPTPSEDIEQRIYRVMKADGGL